jgi:hypothetical protein
MEMAICFSLMDLKGTSSYSLLASQHHHKLYSRLSEVHVHHADMTVRS